MLYSKRESIAESNYASFVRNLENKAAELAIVYSHVPKRFFQKGSAFYTELLTREALTQTVKIADDYGLQKVMYSGGLRLTKLEFSNNQQALTFPKYLSDVQTIQFMTAVTSGNTISIDSDVGLALKTVVIIGRSILWADRFKEFRDYDRKFFVSEIVRINSLVSQVLIEGSSAFNVLVRGAA